MTDQPEKPEISDKVYDFCVKAFRTTRKLLKLNIKLHRETNNGIDPVEHGDIFLFNHFARFETFIPQYLIHEATGAYCRSVASAEFFEGDDRFSQFLYSIGVIPNDMPHLFSFLVREILHGRKMVVFPEGGMVKDKQVVDDEGGFSIYSRTADQRRKHHRGAAVIALALDAFKAALLHDQKIGREDRIAEWAKHLDFDSTELLLERAAKPTVIVPSHITFYPIRVSDNILYQAARLFNKGINKRFAEELIIEGNLLFKDTDMDIRFSKPLVIGDYWRWWERPLLPKVVHSFDSMDELFELKPKPGQWVNKINALGMKSKSNRIRDDYMRSMYAAVTVNLSHIASLIIFELFKQGLHEIECSRFHKMLYLGIKLLQKTDYELHRSLLNPEEYLAIVSHGSSRLDQFLLTSTKLGLVHVADGHYYLDQKLIEEFEIDEIRTENLINVYANEIRPLPDAEAIIDRAIALADRVSPQELSEHRLDDQRLALLWDGSQFNQPQHQEINQKQSQTADANWFFLKSNQPSASAVLLIHGFLAGPTEMRSLAERLHRQGHHVLGLRLKGHGTSPWDLRSRNWHEWAESVAQAYEIIKAYSQSIHIIGFSTGGLLALLHASSHPQVKIKSVTSVCAPVNFKNKNMIFVPLLHHANRLVSWVTSEGLIPFRPNQTENPDINYQHIPVRSLYQLQRLIEHVSNQKLTIHAKVSLYQGDNDPVVEHSSVEKLNQIIEAEDKQIILLRSDVHGVIYQNVDQIHEKISNALIEPNLS